VIIFHNFTDGNEFCIDACIIFEAICTESSKSYTLTNICFDHKMDLNRMQLSFLDLAY